MSFLDIKDPAKHKALVDEYVKVMKTVRRRNMVNRERKLAIGEELQTLFHPIVSATIQAAEKTAEELVPVKKALIAQQQHTIPPSPTQKDLTFGIHATGDGWYAMGNSMVAIRAFPCVEIGDPWEQQVCKEIPVMRGLTGKRGAAGPEGPPGKIGKVGPVGARGGAGARGEQGDKGLVVLVKKGI